MGLLIDRTYFTGLLGVGLSPDTGADTLTKEAERELLDSYIDLYEREYLERILGREKCGEFVSWLSQEEPEEDGKWERLRDALTVPCSPVACYVYMHYVGGCGRSVTRIGVVRSTADDEEAAASPLQIRAWNLMARQNLRIFELLDGEEYGLVEFDKYMLETINELGI